MIGKKKKRKMQELLLINSEKTLEIYLKREPKQ